MLTAFVLLCILARDVFAGFCDGYWDPGMRQACRTAGNDDLDKPGPPKQPAYGAIAVGPKAELGWSYQWSNRGAAEQVALAECRKQSDRRDACKVAVWFFDRCGSIAIGSNYRTGSAHAVSSATAARSALAYCRQAGGVECTVKQTVCSF